MTRMTVSVEDAELRAVLQGLSGRAANLRPAMDDIGEMLMSAARLRFEKEVDPDGQPWTPLAAATVKRKHAIEKEKILTISGMLKDRITREVGARSVTIGSNLAYSAIHQFGGRISRGAHLTTIFRKVAKNKRAGSWDFVRSPVTIKSTGRVAHLPLFVKRGDSNFATRHMVGSYTINIPARPYLGISAGDQQAATEILRRFVMVAS